MKAKLLIFIAAALLLMSGATFAQTGSLTLLTDSIGLDGNGNIPLDTDIKFQIQLTQNTGGWITAMTNGFEIYSPDGATWEEITWDSSGGFWLYEWAPMPPPGQWVINSPYAFDLGVFINTFSWDGAGADTIGFGAARQGLQGLWDTYDTVSYTLRTRVPASADGKTLCVDSCFYPPTNEWKWVNAAAIVVYPTWSGPHCFTCGTASWSLVTDPTSLTFTYDTPGIAPADQTLAITASDAGTYAITATDDADWLTVTAGANTGEDLTVSMDTTGLVHGTHTATITVTSADANFDGTDLTIDVTYDNQVVGIRMAGGVDLPTSYSLSQNYPNPFNPTTDIQFDVPKASNVKLSVYNVLGQEVVTLVDEKMAAGSYVADWDASNASSGVYFYRITAGEFSQTRKMVLMK